jgi:hypothetical protein
MYITSFAISGVILLAINRRRTFLEVISTSLDKKVIAVFDRWADSWNPEKIWEKLKK